MTNNLAPSHIPLRIWDRWCFINDTWTLECLCQWTSTEWNQKGRARARASLRASQSQTVSNSKGRGKVKGKLSSPTGKGKGTPSSQVDKSNVCLYCGKSGCWKRDCRKFKRDQETGQVRQVEGGTFQQVPPPPPPASQGLPVWNSTASSVSVSPDRCATFTTHYVFQQYSQREWDRQKV